ncbi:MAG: phospholipase A [Rhodoferax sp.]
MEQHLKQGARRRRFAPLRLTQAAGLAISLGSALGPLLYAGRAQAQGVSATPPAPETAWQQCAHLTGDREARLSCFDRWAAQQASPAGANSASASATPLPASVPAPAVAPVVITMTAPAAHDCRNPQFTDLSRYWELEAGTDCGTFSIRGYRPISLSWIGSDSVNLKPSSSTADHTAATALPYSTSEVRIQLSVRTKMAQGLLTGLLDGPQSLLRDSLWFGYTQQSYWQLFNGELSRPFRSTDHEPEVTYIYPTDVTLLGGWRLRYSGVSLVHQSNGQPLPLSRSWNRAVLMAGMENGQNFRLQGKVWQRLNEGDDDNPEISDLVGRAELVGTWDINKDNTVAMTLRHSLQADAGGSMRLEWLTKVGDGGIPGNRSGLRFHTQLFTGYGDSLVDYNRRRTGLSIGLSLVEW